MRLRWIAGLAAASLAAGQSMSNPPQCAVPCLTDAIEETGCSAADMECLCSSHTLRSELAQCSVEQCEEDRELSEALIFLEQFCQISRDSLTSDPSSTGTGGDTPTGTPDAESGVSSLATRRSSSSENSAEPSGSSSTEDDPSGTAEAPPTESSGGAGEPDPDSGMGGAGGLSTGATAGISIGAVLGAILLVLAVYMLAKRIRRAKAAKRRGVSPPPPPRVGELGVDGEKQGWRPPVEVSAVTGPTELQAGYPSTHYEMEVRPAELEGNPPRRVAHGGGV